MGSVSASAFRDWTDLGRSTTWLHHLQRGADRVWILVFFLAGAAALAVGDSVHEFLDRDRADQRHRPSALVDSTARIYAGRDHRAGAFDSCVDFTVADSFKRSEVKLDVSCQFVTVFEITRNSNGVFADAVFRLLIGVVALAIMLCLRRYCRSPDSRLLDWGHSGCRRPCSRSMVILHLRCYRRRCYMFHWGFHQACVQTSHLTNRCSRRLPAARSHFEMIKIVSVKATLALSGGRSAWSR